MADTNLTVTLTTGQLSRAKRVVQAADGLATVATNAQISAWMKARLKAEVYRSELETTGNNARVTEEATTRVALIAEGW